MAAPFIDLLKSIAEGITIYEPINRNAQGMIEFQDLAARLIEMERLGLIGRLDTEKHEIASVEYYDLVMVREGLTAEGERMLGEAAT